MKLVHPDMHMQIELEPGVMTELILENPDNFSQFLSELYGQVHGTEGRFVLSEEGHILKLGAYADCVINPYGLDVNGKKILTKVYALLKNEILDTDLYLEYEELLRVLNQFAARVADCTETPLEYETVKDTAALLKLFNFKIAVDDSFQIAGRMVDYLKILAEYTETKLIIWVNLKSYISSENMKYLQETCGYLQLSMLLVESTEGYVCDGTRKYIIDKDGCEIYT